MDFVTGPLSDPATVQAIARHLTSPEYLAARLARLRELSQLVTPGALAQQRREFEDSVCEMWLDGESKAAIADELDCAASTVARILQRRGLADLVLVDPAQDERARAAAICAGKPLTRRRVLPAGQHVGVRREGT